MSSRIDWRNYDYSEGPPRATFHKKVPRESLDDAPITTSPSVYLAPARIVSSEVTPKSTDDLTNYEDELLAKITSKQDRDRTLTYRPSPSTGYSRISAASVPATSMAGTSPAGSSHTQHTLSHDTVSLNKLPSKVPSLNAKDRSPVIKGAPSQSPFIQKNHGDIPYDPINCPMDEDPIESTYSAPISMLEDPPSLQRKTFVPQVPALEAIPSDQDKYAYTSFGNVASDQNNGQRGVVPNHHENIEYDIQNYDEEGLNSYQKRAQNQDTIKSDEIEEVDEFMMWNQAREEWNQMFQAIQQTYQSGNSAHRIAATANSSSNNSTMAHDPSGGKQVQKDNKSLPVATTAAAPTTNTTKLTNVSTRPVSNQSSTNPPTMNVNSHVPVSDIDTSIDDEDKEEENLNFSKPSKLDLYNDATEKKRYVEKHASHLPQVTDDLNTSFDTHIVVNSPHLYKPSQHESKSLSLDDEYNDLDSDSASLEKYNQHSLVKGKTNVSNQSSRMQNSKPANNRVGFHSDDMNQIHEYIQDEEPSVITYEYDDEEGTYRSEMNQSLTQDSLAGHSLNSFYSKSNLSEVEDFFSDILLLGSSDYRNPGRRPVKYKSSRRSQVDYQEELQYKKERDRMVRDRISAGSVMDEDDDDVSTDADESMTLTTIDDDVTRGTSSFDKTKDESTYDDLTFDDLKNDDEGTFLESVDEETSYQETDQDEASTHLERYRKRHGGKRNYNDEEDDEPSSLSVLWGFFENSISAINEAIDSAISKSDSGSQTADSNAGRKMSRRRVHNLDDETLRREDFMRLALDSVFRRKTLMARSSHNRAFNESEMEETLTQISLSAARARHAAKNLNYDETATLDVSKHIKIFSVIIPLPLGLLFEESSHCCWVSRIFENGNAALMSDKTKDKVLLGDHIVAVNETSVVFCKVAKVCKVLSVVEDPSYVELTFIRYIGPIRHSSANMEHEGYEVVDPILSRSQQMMVEKPSKSTKQAQMPAPAPSPAVVSKNTRGPSQEIKKSENITSNNSSKLKMFKIFKRR